MAQARPIEQKNEALTEDKKKENDIESSGKGSILPVSALHVKENDDNEKVPELNKGSSSGSNKNDNAGSTKADSVKVTNNKIDDSNTTIDSFKEQSAKAATSDDTKEITLETMINALSSLSFLMVHSRDIEAPPLDFLVKELQRKDEIILEERTELECPYKVWYDFPNLNYFLFRESSKFVKFELFSELIDGLLLLFDSRAKAGEMFFREPSRVYLLDKRVYDPAAMGYPVALLMDDSKARETVRIRLEELCVGEPIGHSLVRLNVLYDCGIINLSNDLLVYAKNEMPMERNSREDVLKIVRELRGMKEAKLHERSQMEMYYPSFPFNGVQGPFDDLVGATNLRLMFMEGLVTPRITYKPISSASLTKTAAVSAVRASHITDIINREFKPDMSDQLYLFVLSFLQPGEILFECTFDDENMSVETVGFAALLARCVSLFNERGIMNNFTSESQMAIDRALVAWGTSSLIIDRIDGSDSNYSLNNYKLVRASAIENEQFEYIKIKNRKGGMCVKDRIYYKRDEPMRGHYPRIMIRPNYIVDCSDYRYVRDGNFTLNDWVIYRGGMTFLSKLKGGVGFSNVFSAICKRIFDFIVRLNEFSQTSWYTIFRMTETASHAYDLNVCEERGVRVELKEDFFLAVLKGLDGGLFMDSIAHLERLRMESAFIREGVRVALRFKLINNIFSYIGGSFKSYSTRRKIKDAVSNSKLFDYIRQFCYIRNDDKSMLQIFSLFSTDIFRLGKCYLPLTTIDDEFLLFYGITPSVNVCYRLNYITKNDLDKCINLRAPLTNATILNTNLSFGYQDVEKFLVHRTFISTFYSSNVRPFVLNVMLPFKVVHVLKEMENNECVKKAVTITADVSYEHHVRHGTVNILLQSVDARDFSFDDDYIVRSNLVSQADLSATVTWHIIVAYNNFFATLGQRVCQINALTKRGYVFHSLYD